MRQRLLVLALAGFVAPFSARADTYSIDAATSRIAFSVRHLLGTAQGEFHKFSGTIEVVLGEPERSSVEVKIQVASLDTKIRKRDDHLLSAEFFDAKKFPEITFRSRSVKRTGSEAGDVAGLLTLRGITRPLMLHVKLARPLAVVALPERMRWLVSADPIRRRDFDLLFGRTAEAMSGIGQDVVPILEIEIVRRD